jgi:hypothetical protein
MLPHHASKACSSLLSRQILRQDGVRGLYTAMFGDEDHSGENAPLEKLEHIYRLLQALPTGMTPEVLPLNLQLPKPGSCKYVCRDISRPSSRKFWKFCAHPSQLITPEHLLSLCPI